MLTDARSLAQQCNVSYALMTVWLRRSLVPGAQKIGNAWVIDTAQLKDWQPPAIGRAGRKPGAAPSKTAQYQRKRRAKMTGSSLVPIDNS